MHSCISQQHMQHTKLFPVFMKFNCPFLCVKCYSSTFYTYLCDKFQGFFFFLISDEAYVKVLSKKRLGILRMISEHGF